MEIGVNPIVLDLLDWLIDRERTCEEMEKTGSRFQRRIRLYEEAARLGLVATETIAGRHIVKLTSYGLILGELRRERERQERRYCRERIHRATNH
jgi:hypothetical protein